jgi:hypothetical protein
VPGVEDGTVSGGPPSGGDGPAVVRRDATVLADVWLADLVRLAELERQLGGWLPGGSRLTWLYARPGRKTTGCRSASATQRGAARRSPCSPRVLINTAAARRTAETMRLSPVTPSPKQTRQQTRNTKLEKPLHDTNI